MTVASSAVDGVEGAGAGEAAASPAAAPAPPTGPRPVRVGLVVAGAAAVFVLLRLLAIGGDVTLFVRAGDQLTVADEARGLTVAEDSAGYDGQFSYRVARAPLSGADRVDGVGFDRPVDRVARVGYPALAWVASLGGRPGLVPWALVGVNVAALGAIGGLGAALARHRGASTWWGLLPAAAPGLVVALSRDLTEVVAAAALLGGALLLRQRRWWPAVGAMAFAALTRETTLALPLAVVAVAAVDRMPLPDGWRARAGRLAGRPPAWVGLLPVAVYGAWRVGLAALWDAPRSFGEDTPVNGATVPLVRPLGQLVTFATSGDPVDLVQMLQLLLVGVAVGLVVAAALRADVAAHERAAILVATLLLASLTTWDRAVVFLRYPTDALVLGVLVLPSAPALGGRAARVAGALLALTALMWVAVA